MTFLASITSLTSLSLLLAMAMPLALQAQNSPFEPPAPPPSKRPTIVAPAPKITPSKNYNLELRGIMQWGDVWYFSIYDRDKTESHWITHEVGVEEKGIRVIDWDEFSGKLKLSKGPELQLKQQGDTPLPVANRPSGKSAPKKTANTNSGAKKSIPPPSIVRRNTKTSPSSRVPPPRVSPSNRR